MPLIFGLIMFSAGIATRLNAALLRSCLLEPLLELSAVTLQCSHWTEAVMGGFSANSMNPPPTLTMSSKQPTIPHFAPSDLLPLLFGSVCFSGGLEANWAWSQNRPVRADLSEAATGVTWCCGGKWTERTNLKGQSSGLFKSILCQHVCVCEVTE